MNLVIAIAALLAAAQALGPSGRPLRPEGPPVTPGTSSIAGRVTDSADQPIEGAAVVISERPRAGERAVMRSSKALTSRDGYYEFRDIGANTYRLSATHADYLPCAARCPEIELLPGQSRADLNVQMHPAGRVIGRLIDATGGPLSGVQITTWAGENRGMGGMPARSDADGRFEIRGVPPESIFVAAEIHTAGGFTRIYHPGVFSFADAQPIAIEPGSPIEIEIRIPEVTASSIAAPVSGPDGYQVDHVTLIMPETKIRLPVNLQEGVANVINLRPGRYTILARGMARGEPHAAFAFVDVQASDVEIPLMLEPAGNVNGRIIVERGGLPPVAGVRVAAVWTSEGVAVEPSPDEIGVGPDATFRFTGLFGHRDFRVVGLPENWQVTAIRAGRSDITSSGLDIASGSTTELTIVVSRR